MGWGSLLVFAWVCAIFATGFLISGLFVPSRFGLRGDRPANWDIQYLTIPPDTKPADSKNRDYILGYLCAKYSGNIQISQTTHDKKLRLYKPGFYAHCVLLLVLALGAIFRTLAVALP